MRSKFASFTIALLLLNACGGSSNSLIGYVPQEKNVSSVRGTEVTNEGAKEFSFVPNGKDVLVVYFGYTNCPDLCPTTMSAVRVAKKKIGDLAAQVDLAMVTVDPQRDTGTVLNKYLASFSERYHAIVPKSDDELAGMKDAFQASSSITTNTLGNVEVSHSGTAYVVGPSGDVVVEWPFGLQADSMAKDLRLILNGLNADTSK